MTSALVSNGTVIEFYPDAIPNKITLPDGVEIYCADVGYSYEGYSILPAAYADAQPDSTSYATGNNYSIANGSVSVTRTWVTPAPQVFIPKTVTNAQARCWFYNNGLLDQVQAAATAAGGTTLLRWEYGNIFERNHPDTLAIIQAIGKTSAEADQMFIEASAL